MTNECLRQIERLKQIFPRGRFQEDVDGTAIIIPRSKRFEGCHIYEQAPLKSVGLFYVGQYNKIAKHLEPFAVKILRGDGEGIVHLRWTPLLAELPILRTFSYGLPRGRPFAVDPLSDSRTRSNDEGDVGERGGGI